MRGFAGGRSFCQLREGEAGGVAGRRAEREVCELKFQASSQEPGTTPAYSLMRVRAEQASPVQTSELLPRKILAETMAFTKPPLLQSSYKSWGLKNNPDEAVLPFSVGFLPEPLASSRFPKNCFKTLGHVFEKWI